MSSAGGAEILIVPAALLLAVPVLAVGGVILVAAGTREAALWAGRKMTENYNNACASHRRLLEGAEAYQRQNSQAQAAVAQANLTRLLAERATLATQTVSDVDMRQVVAQALREAQTANVVNPAEARAREASAQLDLLRLRLNTEIAAAEKGGVSPSIIQSARAAQTSDAPAMERALQSLTAAWANVTSTDALRMRIEMEARSLLTQARAQLEAARALVQQHPATQFEPLQLQQLAAHERDVSLNWNRLATDPSLALEQGRQLLSESSQLMAAMYGASVAVSDATFHQRATLHGRLDALMDMAREGKLSKTLTDQEADGFSQRINGLLASVDAATSQQLSLVELATDDIKNALFRAVNTKQQQAVGGVIAETLQEHGFHDLMAPGQPAVVARDDGSFRVTGLRNDAPAGASPDDKLVTFTLLPDGRIDFDFGGYVGAACQADATAIFEALRRKGIIIVGSEWLKQNNVNAATFEQLVGAPTPVIAVNKRQALIAERVRIALQRMGYQASEIQETSAGGVRQLDARNGKLGFYHVALDTADKQRVSLDGRDITADVNDGIAQVAAQQITLTDTQQTDGGAGRDASSTGAEEYVSPYQPPTISAGN